MAVATQREVAAQLIAQLRLLDPGVSAEVGTPERKIIDTVSQGIADTQIDLNTLAGTFDLDTKYGTDLDNFLAVFGFARQKSTYATGFITFGRLIVSSLDIFIPSGTIVRAPDLVAPTPDQLESSSSFHLGEASFYTTSGVMLTAGELSVVAPIRASISGENANVATGRIVEFAGYPVSGISSVVNEVPTRGGLGVETDDEFKVRFRNTVFRNVSGTSDQYLALAASTAFTTKANVVGPISRYREYVQVPIVDDATAYDVDGDLIAEAGSGTAGEYTTALSTIPHSKYTYSDLPIFISNGSTGPDAVFYRSEVDFRMNLTDVDRNRGDTKRFYSASVPIGLPLTNTITDYQPNVTLTSVYVGADAEVQAIRPGDLVLFEHTYMSKASRNDAARQISNAVDVYIDGINPVVASSRVARPTTSALVVNNPISKYHVENYRRVNEPEKRPLLGNILLPLYWQPVVDLPDQIEVQGTAVNTYTKGIHYWAIEDISSVGGTIRSRSGIEWSMNIRGKVSENPENGPYTGAFIVEHGINVGIPVDAYLYDRNIIDLQASIDGSKQTTTDVLVHKAKQRFIKLDITVMYEPGLSVTGTNDLIADIMERYLNGLYFGQAVQLSDLLNEVHDVPGVDNVRWSTDVPGNADLARVVETDAKGRPLLNVNVDRSSSGGTVAEIQLIDISGDPTGGTYKLRFNGQTTTNIAYNASSATILAALNAAPVSAGIASITGVGTPSDPFKATFIGTAAKALITSIPSLTGGSTVYASDFFIEDDELVALAREVHTPTTGVADSVKGLIIRQRAQNTWTRI